MIKKGNKKHWLCQKYSIKGSHMVGKANLTRKKSKKLMNSKMWIYQNQVRVNHHKRTKWLEANQLDIFRHCKRWRETRNLPVGIILLYLEEILVKFSSPHSL